MTMQWMDNFTIYGTDASRVSRMLNGVYAEAACDLVADPDPSAGGQYCLSMGSIGGTHVRKVLSAAQTTVGVAARYWLNALPSNTNQKPIFVEFMDTNDVVHIYMTCNPSGVLQLYRVDTAGDVLLGSSTAPVVIANAWRHIETKIHFDAAAGTTEVRLEGVAVAGLTLTGIRTTTNAVGAIATCQNVQVLNVGAAPFTITEYVKDFIIWDGSGSYNNDFVGSCQVYRLDPDADVSLNWTPSSGATGYNLINELTPNDDTNYISAPTPPPAAYVCSLTDLPTSVTSVKAVMPIHRSRKTDGGDGQIQAGMKSAGSTGLGADRTITTAYTYWYDVIERDPNGTIAWTRSSVNAADLQLNRTV